MQVTSMLSAGYLEPVQNILRVHNLTDTSEIDQSKQAKEQEILSEEEGLKAKLGNSAQVHTVYHYSMGTDGRRYITGASVIMKGSEEDLNRVSGGITSEDLQSKKQEAIDALRKDAQKTEDTQNIIRSESEKRKASKENEKAEDEEEAQVRELEQIQREVISHEAAHKAAAGELGGGVSYTYTEGPDGKNYITGGEVPIKFKQGNTPEETLRNMQQVQRAANAPADPSGQDRQVAARASAIASRARSQMARENNSENGLTAAVAKGTPVIGAVNQEEIQNPNMNGAASVLASVKEYQLQNLLPAA